jgi:sporulation protein YlmC with PRC-barrel domain
MRKELIGAASALALMTGAAFAQGNSMTDPTTSNPATPPSAMESAPAPANSPAMSEGGATGSAASAASVEGLMGKNVVGSDGEKLGSVEDVIVDPASGEAKQLVISSGGFLGIGAKQIAVDFSQAQVGMDDDGDDPEVKLNGITQADVEGMPEFEYSDTMTSLSRGTDTGATGGTSGTMTKPTGGTDGTGSGTR